MPLYRQRKRSRVRTRLLRGQVLQQCHREVLQPGLGQQARSCTVLFARQSAKPEPLHVCAQQSPVPCGCGRALRSERSRLLGLGPRRRGCGWGPQCRSWDAKPRNPGHQRCVRRGGRSAARSASDDPSGYTCQPRWPRCRDCGDHRLPSGIGSSRHHNGRNGDW